MNFALNFMFVMSDYINQCTEVTSMKSTEQVLEYFANKVVPKLEGLRKGEAGTIGVIGGSEEHTGAPYFAGIAALRAGADLVYVLTTASAAPVVQAYSPDLIVHPSLSLAAFPTIERLLRKADVLVIGPGLGRKPEIEALTNKIIRTCKSLKKPLVIDDDGLYFVSKNINLIKDYPSPGVILTPNYLEEQMLKDAVEKSFVPIIGNKTWHSYWGPSVAVLAKGPVDKFYGSVTFEVPGGSGRRPGGQGDLQAGILATFFGWAVKANACSSIPSMAASILTRSCNTLAFQVHGRSMTASDMVRFMMVKL